ncbi:MAG: hypothetical protein KC635_16595 [Myxococcales bacterium]|nr:hypothetical protein [Myxococcales bacterium]MCB9736848.1 hypothetical protein [Deltaproteobacteria bacterium]
MKKTLLGLGALALATPFFGACADAVANDPSTTDLTPDSSVMALRFESIGETQTACGEAAGIRVEIAPADDASATQSCEAYWAPATVSDPYTGDAADDGEHMVADCFFVLEPGTYDIQSVEVIGNEGDALECCDADYPATADVTEGETTEFGAELSCDVIGSGALDVYGWLNRAPVVMQMTISPSKFAETCGLIQVDAQAEDPEGDTVMYDWEVTYAPDGATYTADSDGSTFFFAATAMGDYGVTLTVSDEHGESTSLSFPLHVTSEGEGDCTGDITGGLVQDALDALGLGDGG